MAELGFSHRYGRLRIRAQSQTAQVQIPVPLIVYSVPLGKFLKHMEFHFYVCTLEIIVVLK